MISLEELQEGKMFLIDKPLDWTSFDVVKKIRWNICRTYNIKKIKVGHAGTLDPRATGLLVVCTGKFTKKIDEIQAESKVYTGTIKLGVTTATYDTEAEEENPVSIGHLTDELIQKATQSFIGEINQYPPAHSAIKVDGKRLYQLAREGKEVELKPRKIQIFEFKITEIELPFVKFEVHCGKGTYIRSLAHDFGKELGVGGYLTELRRTQNGELSVDDADNGPLEKSFFETE